MNTREFHAFTRTPQKNLQSIAMAKMTHAQFAGDGVRFPGARVTQVERRVLS